MTRQGADMRAFTTAFTAPMLDGYQAGVMRYTYKGVRCLKSPVDIAIYMHVLWQLRPGTVIEIGSHSGGSALLLADLAQAAGLKAPVLSIDLEPPKGVDDPRITFLQGSVLELDAVLDAATRATLPRPWLVTEDSAHSFAGCSAALDFFAHHMETGDLLVIEDGVLEDLGLGDRYDGGPNRAIAAFFETRPDVFDVAEDLCDMFGPNATFNPNGYLRKR